MRAINRRRAAAAPAIAAAVLFLGVLTSCDPCTGIASCSSGAYLAAAGQIVDAATRQGVDGVRIDAVRVGGIEVAQDSLSTVTSGGGFWRIEFTPKSTGTVDVDFQVSPPKVDSYRLHAVRLTTKEHGGDANLNERWVTVLYFYHFLELFTGGAADQRVEGARVTYTRTSGVELRGPGVSSGAYHNTTDFGGRMPLFPSAGPNAVYPIEDTPVVGDLTITAAGFGTTVFPGLMLEPSHIYNDFGAIERYEIVPLTP
jgi:hypothetical protein